MCSPSSQFFDSYLSKNLLFDSTNGIEKANTGENQHLNQSADPKPNTVPFIGAFMTVAISQVMANPNRVKETFS